MTLCQADAYVLMEGPAGDVTDVSKYHMVELILAFHIKKKARNCNPGQLIFYRSYVYWKHFRLRSLTSLYLVSNIDVFKFCVFQFVLQGHTAISV